MCNGRLIPGKIEIDERTLQSLHPVKVGCPLIAGRAKKYNCKVITRREDEQYLEATRHDLVGSNAQALC